ncbi:MULTISPECIES: Rieske (2Fe-2S) protein [Streptomyces]|uniref:Rieske (2Fe-2S) protein n=1 Tax=Streptomyces koelreuteriae TaxID=2838015 RepID=A0ABX8G0U3_9ACTN|nr:MULTISPECIES: Rieske (2Fe-2S) protein [Streptomyces]QWB26966.1 Rieske (2Fe-2S) protein [Streptomyces koelreuteriae]UUA10045.1 Rieske (2Fe-2S) protein [Streptomyces koelreuteriae]UUA17651.1 Rieske (2Fe-2S) protein [Streptomyces sp. CRCS-T-1]
MTSESVQPRSGPSRRAVVAAAGAAGLTVALTACGSDDKASGSSTEQGSGGSASSPEAGAGGAALAKTADIPEGSGKIFKDEKVVVSQPAAGQYKAFSTICTHRDCPMVDLKDDIISCTCHGSEFSVLDGSVKKGPAVEPLAAKQVTVNGDSITLA